MDHKAIYSIGIFTIIFSYFFCTFYGIETTYFNSTIQEKVRALNPNINLEFQKTNIYWI